MFKVKVLIIEDDADIREGVRILLESEGYLWTEHRRHGQLQHRDKKCQDDDGGNGWELRGGTKRGAVPDMPQIPL